MFTEKRRTIVSLFTFTALACAGAVLGAVIFSEDFSSYAAGNCLPDGSTLGPWTVVFAGFGCIKIESDGIGQWLHAVPKVPKGGNTHSALVIGPAFSEPFTYETDVLTVSQTRTKTQPRAWEVGWVVWNYTDNDHFYYFIAKPNGWELGKRDPAYTGGQRFLATGTYPQLPIGQEYRVKVSQASSTMSVWVNDTGTSTPLVTFADLERPYTAGNIGLYTEDAHVHFDDVIVSTP